MPNQPPYGPPYQAPPQPPYPQPYQPPYQPQYQPQYPPQYGPGFGWGPQFGQPAPKKKGKGWIAIPIVLGLAVVVGLWVIGVLTKQNHVDNYAEPQPTATTAPQPADDPTTEPTSRPTNRPTARPTAPRPTRTTPPPPRRPTDYELVARNKFYRTGGQWTVNCRESGARPSNLANAVKYYSVVLSCSNRAWPRQVRAGGWTFQPPNTITMTGRMQSPCSGSAPSSFYCPVNRTIYMAGDQDIAQYRRLRSSAVGVAFTRAGMAFTVAHEYGHHVQEITGIGDAYWDLRYDAPTASARLEINRRMELQASCFAGVFLAANARTYPITGQLRTQLNYLVYHSGDEADPTGRRIHGTMRNHGYWFYRGYNTKNLNACNTFVASSSVVA